MLATSTQDDRCFYFELRAGPPREHWILIWRPGDEDRLPRALGSWAANPQLRFSCRDVCRARKKIQRDEWGLYSEYPPDRSCWIEWLGIGSVVVLFWALVIRWVM